LDFLLGIKNVTVRPSTVLLPKLLSDRILMGIESKENKFGIS
jgi:hypothetical protein